MIQVICCSSLLSVPGRAGAFSRDFTTSLAPECRAFSGALKIEKLKAPLIPGPEGAVDTNDWCIKGQGMQGSILGPLASQAASLLTELPRAVMQLQMSGAYWTPSSYEPRCEKTGLQGFRPGPKQTGLYSHRRWLEA